MTLLLDTHTFLWFCQGDAALSATAPKAWAGTLDSAPLKDPTGVRAAETMTTEFSELAMKWVSSDVIGGH